MIVMQVFSFHVFPCRAHVYMYMYIRAHVYTTQHFSSLTIILYYYNTFREHKIVLHIFQWPQTSQHNINAQTFYIKQHNNK